MDIYPWIPGCVSTTLFWIYYGYFMDIYPWIRGCVSTTLFWIYNGYFMDISRVLLTLGGVCNVFTPFWHFFYYIRLFRAPRRFLGAIKIATES